MLYRLATVGSPRGLRGEVRLNLHTDDPHHRLAPGTQVHTDPDIGLLTIASLVETPNDWYATFQEHRDRTSAEALVHTVLLAEGNQEEGAWYAEELVGLQARRPGGGLIGTVSALEHYPAHDMLIVTETSGARSLVPFVEEIVTEVDTRAGYVVIDAPHGLLATGEDGK